MKVTTFGNMSELKPGMLFFFTDLAAMQDISLFIGLQGRKLVFLQGGEKIRFGYGIFRHAKIKIVTVGH